MLAHKILLDRSGHKTRARWRAVSWGQGATQLRWEEEESRTELIIPESCGHSVSIVVREAVEQWKNRQW